MNPVQIKKLVKEPLEATIEAYDKYGDTTKGFNPWSNTVEQFSDLQRVMVSESDDNRPVPLDIKYKGKLFTLSFHRGHRGSGGMSEGSPDEVFVKIHDSFLNLDNVVAE